MFEVPSQGRVFEQNQDGLCPDSSESGIKTLEKETNSILKGEVCSQRPTHTLRKKNEEMGNRVA